MSSQRLLSLTITPEDFKFTEINPQQKTNTQDFQNLGVVNGKLNNYIGLKLI